MNLQFDSDMPLPPPLLPSHSRIHHDYESPSVMLKYESKLGVALNMNNAPNYKRGDEN